MMLHNESMRMVLGTVSVDEWRMSDLVDCVVEAMKATELDCASCDPDCLRELARAAIEAVRAQDLANTESTATDQQTGQRSEELHDLLSGQGVWALF
jgi:hypothetical protein